MWVMWSRSEGPEHLRNHQETEHVLLLDVDFVKKNIQISWFILDLEVEQEFCLE